MKRMVKNGDLIDVEADGSITVAGKPVGGGGSDYTAGSNIQISEAKEIGVKSALTGIESIKFAPNDECMISGTDGLFHIKTINSFLDFPGITLDKKDGSNNHIILNFESNYSGDQYVRLSIKGFGGENAYGMFTRGGSVPQVPNVNGTYILKATVEGFTVSYTWELQQ